ncbi:maleylpyruvate isomerase family mycothiol-dependent enzyme [Gordonia sp. CPCC 205333]|uniref:maleylpyruvate isomerase family mycothiol-dependent enzyme n=1 Tax=Gordonia sp. CPCC 205333 TaxID=3140790 RepID=UPI003AF3CC73
MLSVRKLAQAERRSFAAFLRELSDEDWQEPSLCAGWTVQDVIAHSLSFDDLAWPELLGRFGRARLSLAEVNAAGLADYSSWEPDQLITRMERCADPRGLTTAFGCRVALLDAMVHQQDIRRPLGRPRMIPNERLVPALSFARFAPPIGAHHRVVGLRFTATDVSWRRGIGSHICGNAEAIMMAIAGRTCVLDELSGPGVSVLRRRGLAS